MKSADRRKLEKLALERLDATANDEERWSFLFRTDGAACLTYCPWSETEDLEFDGDTENLGLPWSQARIDFIKCGGDPNEEELRQWREAKCRQLADGSDSCWIAWVVPVRVKQRIAGCALFAFPSYGDPDDRPILKGIIGGRETLTNRFPEIQ
jgi:hypothetical protein